MKVDCPQCGASLTDWLRAHFASYTRFRRSTYRPPQRLRPCPWCGEMMGRRALRSHISVCDRRIADRSARREALMRWIDAHGPL